MIIFLIFAPIGFSHEILFQIINLSIDTPVDGIV